MLFEQDNGAPYTLGVNSLASAYSIKSKEKP